MTTTFRSEQDLSDIGARYHPSSWPPHPAFPADEFRTRVENVARLSIEQGFDLLVVTSPQNICYLTGYDAISYYVPQALLLNARTAELVAVLREMDLSCAYWLTHLDETELIGYPDEYVSGEQHPMTFVADVAKSRGWQRGTAGVETTTYGLSVEGMAALQTSLPEVQFQDTSRLIEWARTVKTDLEVEAVRGAGKLSDHGMAAALDAMASGVKEAEVTAAAYQALIEGIPEIPSNGVFVPGIGNGPRSASPHLNWYDDVLRTGVPMMYELSGVHKTYAAGLSRTAFLGTPPTDYVDFARVVEEGLEAALPKLRAGETADCVARAWNRVTKPRGYEKKARIGYSIGIAQPGVGWLDNTVSLAEGDNTLLQPNMTIHLMLAIWKEPVGYALSETFIVTNGQAESVSSLPRGLTVKE